MAPASAEGPKAVLGYYVSLNLAPVATLLDAEDARLNELLSPLELEIWSRVTARKRQIDLLGGRLAAKLAVNSYRLARGLAPAPWAEISIGRASNGRPYVHAPQGPQPLPSISHSGGRVLALVGAPGWLPAVDHERRDSRLRLAEDFFHPAELGQIRDFDDARTRWTLKEVCGKLSGDGIVGRTHAVLAIRHRGSLWVSAGRGVGRETILAAACGVAVGFSRVGLNSCERM